MSVEDSIFAVLAPLVDGRVERDVAPAGIDLPYVTFQQVGGDPRSYLEGALASLRNGRFQVNVWGDDRDEVAALARQAEELLVEAPTLLATPLTGLTAIFEPATKRRGTRQDFSINF